MNLIDPEGLKTKGLGVYANVSALFRQVGADIKYVNDDKGNHGIAVTGSIGGTTDVFGASAGGAYEQTDAKDIQQTAGKASAGGGSVSTGKGISVGVDKVEGDGYSGKEVRLGASVGLPAEGSMSKDFTFIIPLPKF